MKTGLSEYRSETESPLKGSGNGWLFPDGKYRPVSDTDELKRGHGSIARQIATQFYPHELDLMIRDINNEDALLAELRAFLLRKGFALLILQSDLKYHWVYQRLSSNQLSRINEWKEINCINEDSIIMSNQ